MFVTFEGGEGSGKSTQARKLFLKLRRLSHPVILIHEPGCTPLGDKIADLLKKRDKINVHDAFQYQLFDIDICPISQLMLFNASRAQLVKTVIQPALKEGKIVVCDRFIDSTIAYQGYGGDVDISDIVSVNTIATESLIPDVTFLLDIPVEEGLARKKGLEHDRFEQQELSFHERVRKGFLEIATNERERFLVIDARIEQKKIAETIWQRVSNLLSK